MDELCRVSGNVHLQPRRAAVSWAASKQCDQHNEGRFSALWSALVRLTWTAVSSSKVTRIRRL